MAAAVAELVSVLHTSSTSTSSSYSARAVMAVVSSSSVGTIREFRGLSVVRHPERAFSRTSNCGVFLDWKMVVDAVNTQTPDSNKMGFSGRGGGAFGSRMNLFDRLARVVKSYANAIVSSFEDPEKILDQAVLEMNDDLTKMRQATAQFSYNKSNFANCESFQIPNPPEFIMFQ